MMAKTILILMILIVMMMMMMNMRMIQVPSLDSRLGGSVSSVSTRDSEICVELTQSIL